MKKPLKLTHIHKYAELEDVTIRLKYQPNALLSREERLAIVKQLLGIVHDNNFPTHYDNWAEYVDDEYLRQKRANML